MSGGSTTTLTSSESSLPNTSGSGSQIPAIAVVTGAFDSMEDVLAKIGLGDVSSSGSLELGTQLFTLIDGSGDLVSSYQEFDATLADMNELNKYDLIIINCGNSHESMLTDSDVINRLRQYVNDGGRIYATDWSYDFVEQVFPEYVDFLGSDSTPESGAEDRNDAQMGYEDITTNAEILQSSLNSWLGSASVKCGSLSNPSNTEGCLNFDGTVHIEDFLVGWAVIDSPHAAKSSAVTLWIEGNVEWSGSVSGVKPLTLSFTHGSGKVLYSSYHTAGSAHPYMLPQERILQYLIFEILE